MLCCRTGGTHCLNLGQPCTVKLAGRHALSRPPCVNKQLPSRYRGVVAARAHTPQDTTYHTLVAHNAARGGRYACPGPLATPTLPRVCTQVLAGIHLPSSQAKTQGQQHTPYVSLQVKRTSNHARADWNLPGPQVREQYHPARAGPPPQQAYRHPHTCPSPSNTVGRHKRRRARVTVRQHC